MAEEERVDPSSTDEPSGPRLVSNLPEIPGYEIFGVIAQGASGTVYRARQLAVEREVALKVLHADVARRKRLVQRLQREARTMARLAHPHIVSAIDMGESDGSWWFAMELVDGPSLALALRQSGRLTEREALRLFIPLCEALVHLWEHGVVHRDVKPANILIDDSGGRIADLGLAFAGDDPVLTAQGGTLGTPHYISPEQARDPSSVDSRADVWSFGATLFHAVCGQPPFGGESMAEVLSGVLHARIPDPQSLRPQLSRGLALVLRKCLSRDVSRRYANPRELLADLERVRERRAPDIDARALEPVQRSGHALRPVWIALAVAGIALAVAIVSWRSSESDEPSPASPGVATLDVEEGVRSLFAEARRDPAQLAPALFELDAYARTAPAALAPAIRDMSSKLRADLRRELRALRGELEARVESRLDARDIVGARALLDEGLERELRERTGFSATSLPEDAGLMRRRWIDDLRDQVTGATNAVVEVLRTAAEERYERFVLPEVERCLVDRAYGSAMRKLSVDPSQLVVDAGLAIDHIPGESLHEALGHLRSRMRVRRDALLDSWARVDAELVQWLNRRADTLETELSARRLRAGAVLELEESLARKLETELASPEEILSPENAAVLRELDRRRSELADLEESLLEVETEERADLFEEVFRSLWSQRDFRTLLFVWGDFEDELDSLPGDRERPWRERTGRRIALAVREAELLEGLLEQAAEGLLRREGEELELLLGSIRIQGRVEIEGDPLEAAFVLRASGTRHRVPLREVTSRDLVALAGLPDDAASRLLRALLFFRDGSPEGSLAELRSGPLPSEGLDGRLAIDLKERAITDLEEERAVVRDRGRAAHELLIMVDSERSGAYRLSAIERLLEEYADVEEVRQRSRDLRATRDRLRAPRPRPGESEYELAFRPAAVELDLHRVRLVFDFGEGGEEGDGAWELGSWKLGEHGWAPGPGDGGEDSSWESLALQAGPRLSLQSPFAAVDPTDELHVRLDLEASSTIAALVVSAGGFHVSLLGEKIRGGGGAPAWLATSGDLERHLSQARDGRVRSAPALLPGSHRIELVVRPRSGRVSLTLDGNLVDTVSVASRNEVTDTIELRGSGELRLLRVEIEGDR